MKSALKFFASASAAALLLVLSFATHSCSKSDDANPSTCDTLNVTYSKTIKPILQSNCYTSCHTGSNPNSGFRLDTYAGVKAKVDGGRLYGAVAHLPGFSAMPKGRPSLPQCDISQIKIWIDAGALNN